jgi:hypothetical protein
MKIVMLLFKDSRFDDRVMRHIKTLCHNNYSVVLFSFRRSIGFSLFELLYFYLKILFVLREGLFDVVHCNDLDTLPLGFLLKKLHSKPLVYDAHEIYGYMVSIPCLLFFERLLIGFVDVFITVSDPLKSFYNNVYNKPVHIVRNCKEELFC